MNFINTILVAFTMFSALPVPLVPWEENNTKYMLLGFPLVGIALGISFCVLCFIFEFLGFSNIFTALLLSVFPLVFTGGLHMDGYCDTIDARSSYQDIEKKLSILSDPHIGAFGVIALVCYQIILVAILHELQITIDMYIVIICIFFLSRCVSGFAVVSLKKAKKDGLVASFSEQAEIQSIKIGLSSFFTCGIVVIGFNEFMLAPIFLAVIGVVFFRWKRMAMMEFNGITGDLSGYLLQKIELSLLFVVLIYENYLKGF